MAGPGARGGGDVRRAGVRFGPLQGASFGAGFALVAIGNGERRARILAFNQASDTRCLRVVGGDRFSLRTDRVEGPRRGVWQRDFHGGARPSGRSTTAGRRDGSGGGFVWWTRHRVGVDQRLESDGIALSSGACFLLMRGWGCVENSGDVRDLPSGVELLDGALFCG